MTMVRSQHERAKSQPDSGPDTSHFRDEHDEPRAAVPGAAVCFLERAADMRARWRALRLLGQGAAVSALYLIVGVLLKGAATLLLFTAESRAWFGARQTTP